MLARKLVRQPGRRARHDRSLEAALQRTPAAQLARLLATQCFCHLPEKTKTRHTHCRLTLGAGLIRGEGHSASQSTVSIAAVIALILGIVEDALRDSR